MEIIASSTSGPSREPLAEGVYLARCYQLYHIGTNVENIQGQDKTLNKVRVGWELPTELHVFNEEFGQEPITLSKEYTLSLNEKANLRKELKSWRGRDFTEEELKAFNLVNLIGAPCMINVVHKKSKDGTRTFEEIASISPLMKGQEMPKAFNIPKILSFTDFDETVFSGLPDFIKDKVSSSVEYKEMRAKQETENTQEDDPFKKGTEKEDDDGLPF